jgi:hypothetical protein
LACGASASWPPASRACKTPLAPAGPGAFPPEERLRVVNLATTRTEEHDQPATRWTLDDLAATLVNEAYHQAISRATIWRILEQADLKPHKSVYWLNSHDPDFHAKAQDICRLYVQAPRLYQQGRLLICCDEKTGMQILGRKYPTQPVQPGKPAKREFEYIRYGTRALITSFAVATGDRLRSPLRPRRHALPAVRALRLGGGQPEHALEPGGLRVRGRTERRGL